MTKRSNVLSNKAKRDKKDEFYTQLSDIEKELRYYKNDFKNKVVYCNCDDAKESNFFHYFSYNFEKLGLKKLITTCYNKDGKASYLEYNGDKNGNNIPDAEEIGIKLLKGNGDFRSRECLDLLKQADIVVTNPPFSLFKEYISQLINNNKKFIVMGHQNAIYYAEIFDLLKTDKVSMGFTIKGADAYFKTPYKNYAAGKAKEGMVKVPGICWYTNIDIREYREELVLTKKYSKLEYPKYDTYKAININKVKDIPINYKGTMGVPITFMHKYNPNQFEIVDKITDTEVNGKRHYARLAIKYRK